MLRCMLYLTLLFPWTFDLAWGKQAREEHFPQATGESTSLLSVGQIVYSVFEDADSGDWDYSSDGLEERLTTWNHGVTNQVFATLGKDRRGHGASQSHLLTGGAKGLGTSVGVHVPGTGAPWIDDTVVSQILFQAKFTPEGIGAFDPQLSARTGLSRWRTPAEPALFSLLPDYPTSESGIGVAYPVLVQDALGVSDAGTTAPSALRRDWGGIGRDTAFFLGYQIVTIGITYLLPESVSKWTEEQKSITMKRWWENVQHPAWDQDNWYVNYIGHSYFGAAYYIRARERGFGAFGSFWYAALLSGLYEFGVEALFEKPSYQDLITTPVGGVLIGALIFEPLRESIKGKPERKWYDHLALTLTDPLGAANSILERVLGIKAEMRVQFRPPALAPHEPFNARPARALTRQGENPRRSLGVSIEFVFNGRERSARRNW